MRKLSFFIILYLIISTTPLQLIESAFSEKEQERNDESKEIKENILYILEKMHQNEIYQSFFHTYSGYDNDDPGFLHFYTEDVKTKEMIIHEDHQTGEYTYGTKENNPKMPSRKIRTDYIISKTVTAKRPFIVKPSVEFITIHDTGNDSPTANALAHAKYVTSPDGTTSWHFSIDDKEIFQHEPLDEVAHHAGDGEREFHLTDTGVKADSSVPKPKVYFDTNNHHLYVNGQQSELLAPKDGDKFFHEITPAGLYVTIGDNGNYWINNYYYNTGFGVVSNCGGNWNSIGIETCINKGIKYSYVMRNIATVVVRLLDQFNLKTDRVMQHRNFSGKECPMSMIRAKEKIVFEYKNLVNLIEEYYFIKDKLPEAKFTYQSLNKDLLDDYGYVLKYVDQDTTVSYVATVEYKGIVIKKIYKTIIHPK